MGVTDGAIRRRFKEPRGRTAAQLVALVCSCSPRRVYSGHGQQPQTHRADPEPRVMIDPRTVRYAPVIGHRGHVAYPFTAEIEPPGKRAIAILKALALPQSLRR